jgi:hypothetical protein
MIREPYMTRYERYIERMRKRRPAKEAWRDKYKELKEAGLTLEQIKAHSDAPKP